MDREELWAEYVRQNPAFANLDNRVTLTVRGLRKLFDRTYDTAQAEFDEPESEAQPRSATPFPKVFEQFFGRKP
jgi:hypothetical protein